MGVRGSSFGGRGRVLRSTGAVFEYAYEEGPGGIMCLVYFGKRNSTPRPREGRVAGMSGMGGATAVWFGQSCSVCSVFP